MPTCGHETMWLVLTYALSAFSSPAVIYIIIFIVIGIIARLNMFRKTSIGEREHSKTAAVRHST